MQTPIEAAARDATDYARRHGLTLAEAMRRLQAVEDSVPQTDQLQQAYRDRLAGLVIEHDPTLRFVMLLTGPDAPPDSVITVDGLAIPMVFRAGAPATRDAILAAIAAHQADLRAALPHAPAMAVDPHSGKLLVLVRTDDAGREEPAELEVRLTRIAGVPVEVSTLAGFAANLAVVGGARLIGGDPASGHRAACSAGFVVTDGMRTGLSTAAHCPDSIVAVDADGVRLPLDLLGAWGAGTQDVQIHDAGTALPPLFAVDAAGRTARALATWRPRAGTRAGDIVCHRGEKSGYSCAEVALVDFAPPGDLCAGPCPATWVAVRGPDCGSGDSGGPVFRGNVAFGLLKGASYDAANVCQLYFYMSVDYLPAGWTLLHQ